MSNVLFINGNLHGHINPTLPIVKALVESGEDVYYFATKEFQAKLEAHGAIFMDLGEEFEQFILTFRPHGAHPFYTLMEYMLAFDRVTVPLILDKIINLQFDYLIHDVMFGGGNIIARTLNIPAISSCSSFVMENLPLPTSMLEPGYHPQLDFLYHELEEVKKEWNVSSLTLTDIFFKGEPLNLVYTSRLFQPQGEAFPQSFHFIGPAIIDRNETLDFTLSKSPEKKIIYISMGTINNNCIELYQYFIEAFKDCNYQVVMSIGSKTDPFMLGIIPDNFIVRNHVPQLEVLKQADLFISHGGLNSVSEALYYGVPVIAIPMANDQPAVAKRLSELGAGLQLRVEAITPSLLQITANTILSDNSYSHHCEQIRESFHHSGGYNKGVSDIFEYVKTKR